MHGHIAAVKAEEDRIVAELKQRKKRKKLLMKY